jgi:hypothetical protein
MNISQELSSGSGSAGGASSSGSGATSSGSGATTYLGASTEGYTYQNGQQYAVIDDPSSESQGDVANQFWGSSNVGMLNAVGTDIPISATEEQWIVPTSGGNTAPKYMGSSPITAGS